MSPDLVATFWLVSFLLVLVPGADWAYVITAGLRDRSIIPALGGLLLGYLALTLVVATGLGALVAAYPVVLSTLTAIGAAYLLWLGVRTLISARTAVFPGPIVPDTAAAITPATATGSLAAVATMPIQVLTPALPGVAARLGTGAWISGMNPKALLLFVALLPQFTDASGSWALPVQLGALGLVHVLNTAIIYSVLGVTVRIVLRGRPQVARIVTRVSGIAMILIALTLVAEQLHGLFV